jgi:hypothetical protein
MSNNALASGCGQYHSDTAKNPTPLTTITFNEIVTLANDPPSVDKSHAQWVIPSTLLTRNFKAQYADGEYWALWADIDEGSPDINMVCNTLNTLWCEYLVYTSRGATDDNRKWRIIIPLAEPVGGDVWPRYQQVLNQVLRDGGLIPDTVNERSAQLCYLPNRGEYYDRWHHVKQTLDPATWVSFLPEPVAPVVRPPRAEVDNPQFAKYLEIASEAGMVLEDHGDGHYTVVCPNYDEHSDGRVEARLTAPSDENRGVGGFSCLHEHCGGLNIGHLYDHVGLGIVVDATTVFKPGPVVAPPGAIAPRVAPPTASDGYEDILVRCGTADESTVTEHVALLVDLNDAEASICIERLSAATNATKGDLRATLKKLRRRQRGDVAHALDYLNSEFHFVRNGGSPLVASFGRNPLGYETINVSKVAQFKELTLHYATHYCGVRDRDIPAADAWLEWAGKNQHERLAFEPGKPLVIEQHDGTTDLNTYTPPVITPVVGGEKIHWFMSHLFNYTCGGDADQFTYLCQWMGDLFQNPGVKPQAGVMLTGSIGAGKSLIPLQLGRILGATYLKVVGSGALSRDFNESQAGKMLIFYDEASEKDASRLRDRITSSEITINGKGKPEYTTHCYARFMVVSNQGVPVDVSDGDRRFFVPDCVTPPGEVNSAERRAYFAPVIAEIEAEGFHAALHEYFLAVDLTGWSAERFPVTQRKRDMLDEGKSPIDQWIDECAMTGVWFGGLVSVKPGDRVPLPELVNSCVLFMNERGHREPVNSRRVGRVLKQRGFTTQRNVSINGTVHSRVKRIPVDFLETV